MKPEWAIFWCRDLFKEKFKLTESIKFTRVHRLGKATSGKTRPIIARFHYFPDRDLIWNSKRHLKGSSVIVREDFPEAIDKDRQKLLPYYLAARDQKMKASLRGDSLLVDGHIYRADDTEALQDTIRPREVCEKVLPDTNTHLFFGCLSPFSNWYPATFKVEGRSYNSAEQFYMFEKARFAKDPEIARKILESTDGRTAKRLGNQLKMDQKLWLSTKAQQVMKEALVQKFKQNKALWDILQGTKGYTLAECNPSDKTWGTGLSLRSEQVLNASAWPGKSLLGKLLTEVRQELAT